MQRWFVIQHELIPELKVDVGALTPKLEKLIHILDWIRIDEFIGVTWCGIGRPPRDRAALASSFVAKAVLRLNTTAGLIERLTVDRALKRICGFSKWKRLPDESIFSRAFAEFAESGLAERAHAALVKATLGDVLVGHISRDGTAIESREKPERKARETGASTTTPIVTLAPEPTEAPATAPKKRGRPKKGEICEAKQSKVEQQCGKPLAQLLTA